MLSLVMQATFSGRRRGHIQKHTPDNACSVAGRVDVSRTLIHFISLAVF